MYLICLSLGVTIELSSAQLSVTEGDDSDTTPLDLCVRLTNIQDSLERDVPLLLNTQTSAAGESWQLRIVHEGTCRNLQNRLFL